MKTQNNKVQKLKKLSSQELKYTNGGGDGIIDRLINAWNDLNNAVSNILGLNDY